MVFTSISFLFLFLPAALCFYFLISLKGQVSLQNTALLLISVAFYAWSGIGACLLLLFSAVINYCLGCHIGEEQPHRKVFFILVLVFNLFLLGFFKYFNFFVDNLEYLTKLFMPGFQIPAPVIPLPVGISFFTFQILSYQIDVYRGAVRPQRCLRDLILYIMLFPQLIAGPIVRYIDVENEIRDRRSGIVLFSDGIRRFIIGFSKKVLLADRMGYLCEQIFVLEATLATPYAWLGAICYSLQIYLDFSAYSDMAIGLGHMFGFHFMENFNYPFISKSIKEFWNRWHLSLSTWFRDYVYIPLGGSRKGIRRTCINTLFVFFLTGLWHGASWNFVIWGMIQGVFICLERAGLGRFLERLPGFLRHAYVLIIFTTSMVFFRSSTFSEAMRIIQTLYNWNLEGIKNVAIVGLLDRENLFFICLSIFACIPVARIVFEKKGPLLEAAGNLILCFAFIVAVCYRMSSGFNPFIYFRF